MTTQNIQATVMNNRLGKIFTKSDATDGQWDSNTLTDSLSSQQIGILMPNMSINRVQLQYAGGLSAWRIQNSATLQFSRFGFGVKDGLACWESSAITPYMINPNDILVTYPQPVNSAPNLTNVLAWVVTTKGVELFSAAPVDATATAMNTVVNNQSLGDSMFNSTLQSIHIQCEDGAVLDAVEVIDNSGGTVWTAYGGVRGSTGGAMDLSYNLKVDDMAIPVGKGFSLKVTTTTG